MDTGIKTVISFTCFVATVYTANFLVDKFGIVSIGFGLFAPAGVYAAGIGFSARDWLQSVGGKRLTIVAILTGAILAAVLTDPVLAFASGVAFLLSELLDFGVYTPLKRHNVIGAMLLSNTVGSIVDSMVFLLLAFGSLEFLVGQFVGKMYMTFLVATPLIAYRYWICKKFNLETVKKETFYT